ncbi:MAG: hypothetical protein ACREJN_13035, partial [Nitrospiraceae bacterium]
HSGRAKQASLEESTGWAGEVAARVERVRNQAFLNSLLERWQARSATIYNALTPGHVEMDLTSTVLLV